MKDSPGKNTPTYGTGRRGMSKGVRGNEDQRGKKKTGRAPGFKKQCQRVSKRCCYYLIHLKRIRVNKIPLDLARGITGGVMWAEARLQGEKNNWWRQLF